MEKELLYYEGKLKLREKNGYARMYRYFFRKVSDGFPITITTCMYREKGIPDQENDGILFDYSNIIEALKDYDILWQYPNNKQNDIFFSFYSNDLDPIDVAFNDIHYEYLKLIKQGVAPLDANEFMIKKYNGSLKR